MPQLSKETRMKLLYNGNGFSGEPPSAWGWKASLAVVLCAVVGVLFIAYRWIA